MSAPSTKGAVSYQPGATPQEWNHPTQPRAEGPTQHIVGHETENHFRGVTKLIAHGMGRAFSPLDIAQSIFLGRCPRLVSGRAFGPPIQTRSGFLGRCPRLVWRWAFGPEAQTAPTARCYTSLGQRPRIVNPNPHEG